MKQMVSDTRTEIKNPPGFLFIGCGGAGIRILDQIGSFPETNTRKVAIDSDTNTLEESRADIKIFLEDNPIQFQGERSPAQSASAVLEVKPDIESLVEPQDTVIILAGLGRGVGSGAAPQIAKIARDRGALVIAIGILPYQIQTKTIRQAAAGLESLLLYADSVIVMDNQRIRGMSTGALSVAQEYAKLNGVVVELLNSLIRSMTVPSRINLDPEDFDAIFRSKGLAMILCGESRKNAKNKNESVARECLNYPYFDIDYRSATGSLVLIIGGNDINGYDAEQIATSVTLEIDPHADVAWCTDSRDTMDGEIRVYVIMTGIRGR